jgi:hypothetical protein
LCGLTFELSGAQRRGPWAMPLRVRLNEVLGRTAWHQLPAPNAMMPPTLPSLLPGLTPTACACLVVGKPLVRHCRWSRWKTPLPKRHSRRPCRREPPQQPALRCQVIALRRQLSAPRSARTSTGRPAPTPRFARHAASCSEALSRPSISRLAFGIQPPLLSEVALRIVRPNVRVKRPAPAGRLWPRMK